MKSRIIAGMPKPLRLLAFLWAAAACTAALPGTALRAAAAPPLSLAMTVTPSHGPPLLAVTISVAVVNHSSDVVTLVYPTPDLFFIEVRDAQGQVLYDSRNGHQAIPIKRAMRYNPGTTHLESFEWDTLNNGRRALQSPGVYTVHVEMKSVDATFVADRPLTVDPPSKISAVLSAPNPFPATIAGTPVREGGTMYLRDDSGEVALSHPLGINPRGTFIVRGFLQKTALGQSFVIDRFAPAVDNLDPQGTPTPRASATPT